MMKNKVFRRGAPAVLALTLTLTGCDWVDSLLEADNPAQIREDQLDDATLAKVLANSVLGDIGSFYDDPLIWRGTMITDEVVQGINWEATARVSQRILPYDIGDANTMFRQLSQFRFLADSVAGRLQNLLTDPAKSRDMAAVLAHAGYSYTLMGEYMCEATLNVEEKIYTPVELAQLAIPRFEQAITVAQATGASATDVLNLARVGLARAALMAGDKNKAMAAAAQVPYNYVWWVEYQNTTRNNYLTGQVTGANHNMGIHPRWLPGTFGTTLSASAVTDPRMPHRLDARKGHNALTLLYTPFQPMSYSKWNGRSVAENGGISGMPLFDNDTDIKLASGIEAMHHYYEAAGPTGTGPRGTTLQFVNERRAAGKQPAVTLSGAALMAELRTQRFKDLYLGGFRLGDLRRYAAQGINDPMHTFPSGRHPNEDWGDYGDATCWPLPLAEFVGNPNIKR